MIQVDFLPKTIRDVFVNVWVEQGEREGNLPWVKHTISMTMTVLPSL